MRNHPSRPINFPVYARYRQHEKDQAARRPNPEHRARKIKMAEKRCKAFGERGINLTGLPPHSLVPAIVEQQGWGHFIRRPPMYDEELVKEFYANMNPPVYHERYTVIVRGTPVRISIDDIAAYHHVPRRQELNMSFGLTDHDEFTVTLSPVIAGSLRRTGEQGWVRTTNEVLKSDLHIDLAFLMLFLKSSLKPSSHNTTTDPQVAQVLFSLQHGLPMDVGHIIWMEILDAGMTLDGILPFPCMITYFCQQAVVPTGQLNAPKKDFDHTHYTIQIRAAAERDRKRQEEQMAEELDPDYSEGEYQDDDDPDDQGEYPHTGNTPPWATNMMQRIDRGFSSINTRIDGLAERMNRAGIPQVQPEEQSQRRVRRRDTGGASSSRG